MKILEYKNLASSAGRQKIIIEEGEEREFLIPIFGEISLNPSLQKRDFIIDFEINANASVQVYVLGVVNAGSTNFKLNSINLGENSSFDAKVGFVQFGDSAVDFSGLMKIANGAKNSSANLHVESLLLSPHAKASLIPSLEILENEVSAGHGAVVKSIDPNQIFYLRSRGIPLGVANELLVQGFVNSFGVELPKETIDEFNLIITGELSKIHCALDCEWCEK